ncbi:MAG TPA: YraN family protein [Bacteroidota bacterium]|nr:YraN family protein [Bacteroidota bacterium]
MNQKNTLGKEGESLAVKYLQELGFEILECNYRFQHTEIDIVAKDGDDLVFVEVKTRTSARYGTPEDALTEIKEERLYAAAEGYYFEHNIDDQPCRFDFIGIEKTGSKVKINHIKNVFHL